MLANIGDIVQYYTKKEIYLVLGYDKDFYRDGSQFYIEESYEEYLKLRYLTVNFKLLRLPISLDNYEENKVNEFLNKQIHIEDVITTASKKMIKKIGHIAIDANKLRLKNLILGTNLNIYTREEFDNYVKEYYDSCSKIPLKEVTEIVLYRLYNIGNKVYACIGYSDTKKEYILGYIGDYPYGVANRDRVNIISFNNIYRLGKKEIEDEVIYEYPSKYILVKQQR